MTAAALALVPSGLSAQLRRAPAIQPAAEVRAGESLLGLGAAFAGGTRFPLSGLEGDLLVPVRATLAHGLADRVVLELRWDAWRVLEIERRTASAVPLDSGVEDGRTADVGDARLGVLFAPLGGASGPALGGRIEVKLPNTSEDKGIGANTTDLRLSVLGSLGVRRWRLTADVGVGILEVPLEDFEQNDVAVYAAELLVRPARGLRLSLGVDGRASTRGRVPLGTEDRGEAGIGTEVQLGRWLVDARLAAGYAGSTPDWTVEAGAGRLLGPRRRPAKARRAPGPSRSPRARRS